VDAAVDACPGVLTLHPARDGHVARIRLPGGYVTRQQWAALAALAREFGDGSLDLTARGNVQLRGLALAASAPLSAGAARAGLLPSAAHDRSRNITASPLSGLGGRPPLRRLVRALDAALVADPVLAALPGRFLFAVDDGTGGAALARCDIGLLRAGRHVEMVIGGRRSGAVLPPAAAVSAAVAAARAAVAAGVGRQVSRISELPGGGAAVAAVIGGTPGAALPDEDRRLSLGADGAAGPGVLVTGAPLGRLTAAQAALTGSLLRGSEVLRLATAGRLVIPVSVPPASALDRLAGSGLLTRAADALSGVTACSGLACRRSLADVRTIARPLPGWPRTHWAGCARGCGAPPDAEVVTATETADFLVRGQPVSLPVPAAAS